MASAAQMVNELQVPDKDAVELAAEALAQLTAFLQAHPTPTSRVRLCTDDTDDETQIVVPSFVLRFFIDVLAQVANGNAVTVASVHAELTTQQAADLLNVSRPYLIKLLDEERRIPYRRVGNRRKVLLTDLLDYKRQDDEHRRRIVDELTQEAQAIRLEY